MFFENVKVNKKVRTAVTMIRRFGFVFGNMFARIISPPYINIEILTNPPIRLRMTAKISMCGRNSTTLVSSKAFTKGNTYMLTVSEFNKPSIISPARSKSIPVVHTEIQPYFRKDFLLLAYGNSIVNTMSSPYGKVNPVGKTEEKIFFQLVRNTGVKWLNSK